MLRSWWWMLGFPLWYGIAFKGMRGMQKYLSEANNTQEQPCFQLQHDSLTDAASADEEISANRWDFYIAIVFVVFGVVALAAGLTANILFIIR
jgi:hypothetical protein